MGVKDNGGGVAGEDFGHGDSPCWGARRGDTEGCIP